MSLKPATDNEAATSHKPWCNLRYRPWDGPECQCDARLAANAWGLAVARLDTEMPHAARSSARTGGALDERVASG